MEVADELRGVDKLSVGFEQGEVVRPGDGTGDEAEDLPALLVKTKGPGCATEADRVQVGKQRVDSRCPGTCRAAHCVAHAHDTAADVPAGQRDLVTAHLAQSGSLSRGGVGRRGWNRRVAWQEPVDVTAQRARLAALQAEGLWDPDEDEHALVARATSRVARLLRAALAPAGVNLVHATGTVAWQSVFHFHVQPVAARSQRWSGYPHQLVRASSRAARLGCPHAPTAGGCAGKCRDVVPARFRYAQSPTSKSASGSRSIRRSRCVQI